MGHNSEIKLGSGAASLAYLGRHSHDSDGDVRIVLKDGTVKSHRILLAASCRVLRSCLRWLSAYEDDFSVVLNLPDFSCKEMRTFLDLLCGKVSDVPIDLVGDLARAVGFRWIDKDSDNLDDEDEIVKTEISHCENKRKVNGVKPQNKNTKAVKVEAVHYDEFEENGEWEDYDDEGNEDVLNKTDPDNDNDWNVEIHDDFDDEDDDGDEDFNVADFLETPSKKRGRKRKPRRAKRSEESEEEYDEDEELDEDYGRAKRPYHRRSGPTAPAGKEFSKTCTVCQLTLESEEDLLEHLSSSHRPSFAPTSITITSEEGTKEEAEGKGWACPEEGCDYSHAEVPGVEAHLRWRHGRRHCLYCQEFVSADSFAEHLQELHSEMPGHPCGYCPAVLRRRSDHNRHVLNVHQDRDFVRLESDAKRPWTERCHVGETCEFASSDRFELISHMAVSHNALLCPFCCLPCSTALRWRLHAKFKHDVQVHICTKCTSIFRTSAERLKHKREAHSSAKEERMCEKCGTPFTGTMTQHSQRCPSRFKGTTLRPKLIKYDKHPKLHNIPKLAEGLFQCPEEGCTMTKPDKGKIVKHFNCAHNKQTCEYCGKPYSFYAIHEHIAFKHTGETRNVKCPDCDEMFYNNYYVRLHQESVHKQKIFVCPVCGAEFNNRRAEIEHRAEKHTRKRNYPCPYCGKIFRSRTLIQPHCNEAHGGLTVDIKSITSL